MGGYLLIGLVMAIGVAVAASVKGRTTFLWFLYGWFLWPVALIHILVSAPNESKIAERKMAGGEMRKCPACAELVKRDAVICRFCHSQLPPLTASTGAPTARSESAERDRRTGTMALVALASVIGLLLMFGSRGGTGYSAEQLRIDECAARGVAYFKEIGSFPTLSNGRDARSEATERCRRTTSAF